MSFIANRFGRRGNSLEVGGGKEVLSAINISFAVVVVVVVVAAVAVVRCSRVVLNTVEALLATTLVSDQL